MFFYLYFATSVSFALVDPSMVVREHPRDASGLRH